MERIPRVRLFAVVMSLLLVAAVALLVGEFAWGLPGCVGRVQSSRPSGHRCELVGL